MPPRSEPNIRLKIVKMAREKHSIGVIMKKLKVSWKVASRWMAEAKKKRMNVQDQHRKGRPLKFGSAVKKIIRAQSRSARATASQMVRKFNEKHAAEGLTISNATVCRMLHTMRAPPKWGKIAVSRSLRKDLSAPQEDQQPDPGQSQPVYHGGLPSPELGHQLHRARVGTTAAYRELTPAPHRPGTQARDLPGMGGHSPDHN